MIKIYNADALTLLSDPIWQQKFDAIITDPPYLINYKNWDNDTCNIYNLFSTFKYNLKRNGNLIIFAGWTNVCDVINFFQKEGFVLKNWIIWDRVKCKNPGNNLTSAREDILWFIFDNNDNLIFNKMDSTIVKKTKGMGRKNGSDYRRLSNVWTDISPIMFTMKEYQGNDCQKPVALMERCVEVWTNEGDIVIDTCMGSGATGVACDNLDRSFIGIEKNKETYEKAKERLF